MRQASISLPDLHSFFESFCQDFSSFDGALVAQRYATPYLALNADGVIRPLHHAA